MKLLYTRNLQEESYPLDLYGQPFKKRARFKTQQKKYLLINQGNRVTIVHETEANPD